MANFSNVNVEKEAAATQVEMGQSFTLGFGQGLEDEENGVEIPDFYFAKKLYMLKEWEAGYYMGRQIAKMDRYSK